MRACGILMPVFSLPGPFGIGTLGKEAFAFVDFLAGAKQTYWQILPIGPTGYGDSPYQSFSAFAGNPYFIDYRLLVEQQVFQYIGVACESGQALVMAVSVAGRAHGQDLPIGLLCSG